MQKSFKQAAIVYKKTRPKGAPLKINFRCPSELPRGTDPRPVVGPTECISSCRPASTGGFELPEVEAHITGTVWKIEVEVGDSVQEGDTVVILESMKMEMPVEAEDPGWSRRSCARRASRSPRATLSLSSMSDREEPRLPAGGCWSTSRRPASFA